MDISRSKAEDTMDDGESDVGRLVNQQCQHEQHFVCETPNKGVEADHDIDVDRLGRSLAMQQQQKQNYLSNKLYVQEDHNVCSQKSRSIQTTLEPFQHGRNSQLESLPNDNVLELEGLTPVQSNCAKKERVFLLPQKYQDYDETHTTLRRTNHDRFDSRTSQHQKIYTQILHLISRILLVMHGIQ
jgi:hypothetical protein